MNYKKLVLVLLISFMNCKKNDSDRQYIRGYDKIPKQMHDKIPEKVRQLINNKSLHLIDSVLVKTSVLKEIGLGFTYSNDELGYLNTYRIDTTHYKIIEIEFDLNLNVVKWDTIIYVP